MYIKRMTIGFEINMFYDAVDGSIFFAVHPHLQLGFPLNINLPLLRPKEKEAIVFVGFGLVYRRGNFIPQFVNRIIVEAS